jgi:ribosomal protein L40E
MAEILTESFCERCGTRYTFEASAPSRGRVARIRLLSKGLRNYVMSDESTLEEALDEARGEEERTLSVQQLEAFHQTFNFCMSCRQYTCANCWNEAEARCLSCAPDLSQEVLPTAFPDLPIMPTFGADPATAATEPVASAWPSSDLPADLAVIGEASAAGTDAGTTSDEITQEPAEIEEEPDERLAARLAALGALSAASGAVDAPIPGPPAISPQPDRTPEEDEAEIAAMLAAAEAATLATAPAAPAAPAGVEPEPTIERPAAEAPPAPTVPPSIPIEPTAPEPPAGPVEPPAAIPVAATLAERSGWAMVAPETPPVSEEGAAAEPSDNGHRTELSWPTQSGPPQWPVPPPRPAPVAAGSGAHHGTNALWVASTRDVVSSPGSGVSACVSCGLPLSAHARFCRRCGSRQVA